MKITGIKVEEIDEHYILSGLCDEFKLWYKFPSTLKPEVRGDAFLAACLIPSMVLGTDIVLEDEIPVSPTLLNNINRLQEIFVHWGGFFGHNLQKIKIIGGTKLNVTQVRDKCISFFSGGVDGTYTFLKNKNEIDFLLFVKGIDIRLTDDSLFFEALENNQKYLSLRKKELVQIESNIVYLGYEHGISWNICFGGGLSSIALAANIKKCYIASGLSYKNIFPGGSSYITDHLWGNGFTEIVHDGAESSRTDKLEYISHDKDALNILRVCWHGKGYNCGTCEKCLRTMTNIRALKLSIPTFPDLTDELIKLRLSKLKIYREHGLFFVNENIERATLSGDIVLVKALGKIKRSYEIRTLIQSFDKLVLAGFIKKLKTYFIKSVPN